MDTITELIDEYQDIFFRQKDLSLHEYHTLFPNETFPTPQIVLSYDIHNDAIKSYRNFNYSDDDIQQIEDRARGSWNNIRAVTIYDKMNLPPLIITNALNYEQETFIHELTHVSDFYNYCKRHNLSELTFLEFKEVNDFLLVYLLTEFRAFYRCAMYCFKDLNKQMDIEYNTLSRCQDEAIKNQQLESYYYCTIRFTAFYCAQMERYCQDKVNSILHDQDKNILHTLFKFLYPLRNKSFDEIENHFPKFRMILDSFIRN